MEEESVEDQRTEKNWNKERQMKNEGKRVIGMFWFDERATQNGHVSV